MKQERSVYEKKRIRKLIGIGIVVLLLALGVGIYLYIDAAPRRAHSAELAELHQRIVVVRADARELAELSKDDPAYAEKMELLQTKVKDLRAYLRDFTEQEDLTREEIERAGAELALLFSPLQPVALPAKPQK